MKALASCAHPSAGSAGSCPRSDTEMRHFGLLILPYADVRSRLLRPLVDSCVEVYTAASGALLPTPSRSHYTFNFRDVVKVMQVGGAKICTAFVYSFGRPHMV